MIRCIVIDDEKIARDGLLEFIREFDFLECVGDYANALLAKDLVINKEIDLVFLDIEMPRIKGIDFAEMINNAPVMIIFTTAYPDYALKGYKVNAIDYLLKPIFFEDFEKAVLKAKNIYNLLHPENDQHEYIFFRENGIDHRIFINEIIYIKSLQNYVQIYLTEERTMIIHRTLKSIIELLPEEKFIQIHRSFVVQTQFISAIDGSSVMVNSKQLPLARDRKIILNELIRKF